MASTSPIPPDPGAVGGPAMGSDAPRERVCGRCRRTFPADPTLPDAQATDWWACDPCRTALFGDAAP